MVEADGGGSAGDQGLLAWLGLGRVPAILVVTFLLLIFGGVGLLLCTPLSAAFGSAAGFFATVPVASASAFVGTSLGTRGLALFMPQTESYAPDADDLVSEIDGVRLVVDPVSLDLVAGCVVDFVESLGGAAFRVENPNATAGCGCGSSFSV